MILSSFNKTIRLQARRLKRLPMNLMIRDLVTWEPQGEQVDGYSIAIACMRELAPVAIANLRLCADEQRSAAPTHPCFRLPGR